MQQPINSDSSFFLLLDIARMLRARFELAVRDAPLGITPSEARTLANIARFGPINQNDLADLSGFGAMSAARVLKSLETAGLVSRSTAPNDRRIKMVQITEQAKPLLAAVKNIGDDVESITRGNMSSQNWSLLQSMLETVRDNHLTAYHDQRAAE